MLESLREWLASVAAVSLLLSTAQMLVPEGSLRKTASFIGGLLLLMTLLRPLLGTRLDRLSLDLEAYQSEVEARLSELEAAESTELKELIETNTAAYIWDKADALGLAAEVRVTAEPDGEGTPVPSSVDIRGPYSPELAAWIEREAGIPQERQVWHDGED